MNALREKQRAWIAYRDRTANAEGAKFAGGSAEPLAYIGTMATLTEERCYELVGDYMR